MTFKFCPVCGSYLASEQRNGEGVPVCKNTQCRFVFWQNAKPCVGVLLADDTGQVLMGVRGIDPDRGKLDLPGGFLKEDEHPFDGARREIREELGIEIQPLEELGFVIDRYGVDGVYTLNIGIYAKILSGTPQAADDVAALEWRDPATIDPATLSFTNNKIFLDIWSSKTATHTKWPTPAEAFSKNEKGSTL